VKTMSYQTRDLRWLGTLMLAITVVAGCNRSGQPGTPASGTSLARVETSGGAAGEDVTVNVVLTDAEKDIVTVISELRFDSQAFTLEGCSAADEGPGSGGNKGLHCAQPKAGVMRCVVAGDLNVLTPNRVLYSCRLEVAPEGTPGSYRIELSGEAANTQYVDLPYEDSTDVTVGGS
jgi:hypothetical protein